jgi:squalene-hopene/tetraprenyl-beta-curcumene cyclase
MIDQERLHAALQTVRRQLLSEREPSGYWTGRLSSSALSTATAVSALALVGRNSTEGDGLPGEYQRLVDGGLGYLVGCQNSDGGWGDTDKSLSNIATTMLVRAAFHISGHVDRHQELLNRAVEYIDAAGGLAGLQRRYGRDKTFAVPILTNCALAGLVSWREVAALPFELACFPHAVYRFLRMPVVSYAVPALVAIGQARYFHRKPSNPITRLVRRLAIPGSLKKLRRMQPDSGGFLEATPLTSFVVMSLASIGRTEHPVVKRGVEFLVDSVREDGSWPIDTNLAAWVTTLSINALDAGGENVAELGCLDWLLSCQHRERHPFTNADPGGWGWTNLSGAVPDADDTPGALVALGAISRRVDEEEAARILTAAGEGVRWLLDVQNSDGGWPTFCRGWGKLPFDRSGADLTAHAIRALSQWRDISPTRIDRAIGRGFKFLDARQRADGSWVPLWFGNQHHPAEENPVYGTARVLLAYRDLGRIDTDSARRGVRWLVDNQQADGGWSGGESTSEGSPDGESGVEETAVACEALLPTIAWESSQPAISKGLNWLIQAVESGRYRENSPIGFYFAKLWYHERLYPIVFTASALGRAVRMTGLSTASNLTSSHLTADDKTH